MNIAQAKAQIKDAAEAYFTRDDNGVFVIDPQKQRPLFMIGAPGIGKTAIMSQIAAEMGIGLVSYSMTHHTRQSALGLPFIVHRNFDGFEYDASEYTMSEIIATIYDYMQASGVDSGILFLDEINCVSETLYPSMLQFLQFKTFGRHKVPDNWMVVCAGNPPEYNKSVHDFDIVTLDRLRKIVVEPDYAAWRTYALERNVHPAITSFLEVKPDCFYSVASTPEGKSFVTARGWEDLSQLIRLFETTGKPVDIELIGQFLQDTDIAEKFALHYDLFNKYKSDYNVADILAGATSAEIIERAKNAAFDERLALISMMLDILAADALEVSLREEVILSTRDELRALKEALQSGASVEETLGKVIAEMHAKMQNAALTSNMDSTKKRSLATLAATYQALASAAVGAGATSGTSAFDVLQKEYEKLITELQAHVAALQAKIDNAFAFTDDVFDAKREGLVLATEVTAHKAIANFIAHFGSESYYQHNEGLQLKTHEDELQQRISELNLEADSAVKLKTI